MLEKLSIFGIRAMWSPGFFLFTIALGILYILLAKKLKASEPITNKQYIFFITALILLYIVKGSPVDLLGHLNFSVHMVQMSILYLILPPLFLLATPNWLFRRLLSIKPLERTFVFLTKPLIALIVFNGSFSFYHFPVVFDLVKTNPVLHATVTTIIFISAIVMWWPLICPIKEYRTLSGLTKLAYIFANGVLLTPACALIIFAEAPLFRTYTDTAVWAKSLELCVPTSMLSTIDLSSPQLFSWLAPRDDQRLGGVIMKIVQEIVYGIALGIVFFGWVKDEKEKDRQESMSVPTPQLIK